MLETCFTGISKVLTRLMRLPIYFDSCLGPLKN